VAREAKRAADLFLLLGGLGQAFLEARAAAAAAEVEGAAMVEGAAIQVTEEGLAAVESHLTKTPGLTAEAPELKMLERLKGGERTPQDLRFYEHELIESQELQQTRKLYSDPVDAVREAHHRTLMKQGLYYKGYEKEPYHPDALRLIER
jgi:hypothetical protein